MLKARNIQHNDSASVFQGYKILREGHGLQLQFLNCKLFRFLFSFSNVSFSPLLHFLARLQLRIRAHAHVQRLSSVAKLTTVLEVCTTEEQSCVVRFFVGKRTKCKEYS
jgi:hypothetical protein